MTPIQIEPAAAKDFDGIFKLLCALEEQPLDEGFCFSLYARLIKTQSNLFYVARDERGCVAGFAHLRIEPQLHHAALVAELMELCVSPVSRGEGIGRSLYEAAAHAARQAGCTRLEFCCNLTRTRAHRFYERLGAKKTHWRFSQTLD